MRGELAVSNDSGGVGMGVNYEGDLFRIALNHKSFLMFVLITVFKHEKFCSCTTKSEGNLLYEETRPSSATTNPRRLGLRALFSHPAEGINYEFYSSFLRAKFIETNRRKIKAFVSYYYLYIPANNFREHQQRFLIIIRVFFFVCRIRIRIRIRMSRAYQRRT